MEYVKVESSQIDSVGFGEGVYGPETLGIRFKQKNGIGEYHYDHVTARTFQALVAAESVGKYFGANIKNRPEFPFMKVAAPDPTPASTNARTVDAETPASTQSNGAESTTVDNPSTSLAIIDNLDNSALFAAGGVTDAQLAAGREWYLTEAKKYDISTEAKRTELKRFARPLQKLRTGIEARAKEFTGETKRKIAAIDTEKRRLVQIVGDIEDAVLAPLTAWEHEDEERRSKMSATVNRIVASGMHPYEFHSIISLETEIDDLEHFDLSTMQEYKVGAESAISATLKVLKPELERRKQAEAERVELEALRAAAAARAEQDRQDELKRQEDARIAAAVEAAKVQVREEVIAELKTADPEVIPFEYPKTPAFDPSPAGIEKSANQLFMHTPTINHKQAIHAEIVEELQGCMLTRQEAISVLKAITEGRIPHVAITY